MTISSFELPQGVGNVFEGEAQKKNELGHPDNEVGVVVKSNRHGKKLTHAPENNSGMK